MHTSTSTTNAARDAGRIIILNSILRHRIERTDAGWEVINGWGYIGTFPTLAAARRAHVASNRPVAATAENPDGI